MCGRKQTRGPLDVGDLVGPVVQVAVRGQARRVLATARYWSSSSAADQPGGRGLLSHWTGYLKGAPSRLTYSAGVDVDMA
jgi:hypothetical protein